MNIIKKEINKINEILGKNENINVLYSKKNTKFARKRFNFGKVKETKNEKKLIQLIYNFILFYIFFIH